jgi:hypothetical protein
MLKSNWNCSNVVFLSQTSEMILRSDLQAKRNNRDVVAQVSRQFSAARL